MTDTSATSYSLAEKVKNIKELLDVKNDIQLDELLDKLNYPLSVKAYNGLRRIGVETLNDLLSLSSNDVKSDRRIVESAKQEVIDFVHSLGYNLKDESKISPSVNPKTPLEEFVPVFPKRAINALKRGGINNLGDLLSKSTSQILEIKHIGEGMLQEIINFVHSLGFGFSDEENIINLDEQIEQQSQENNEIAGRIAFKSSMLTKYNKLIREKQALLEKEKELDRELAFALETLSKLVGGKDEQKVK